VACSFELRGIFQDPAIAGGVVDRDHALLHHLFELAVAYGIRHVPPDACEDDVFVEMGTLEADYDPPQFVIDYVGLYPN
jgi:hypothetical protein